MALLGIIKCGIREGLELRKVFSDKNNIEGALIGA